MKVSKNFDIRELVPPEIWSKYGASSTWFINPQVIKILEALRLDLALEFKGAVSIRVNTWLWGGNLKERGYRLPDTTTGAKYSQHKRGAAVDFDAILKGSGNEIPADKVREYIIKNSKRYLELGLTTLESGEYAPTWVHFDTRNTGLKKILIVKP